ncbi:MAG: hypothetical protein HW398_103 [Acidobacteria bacterium]|nr:hypothetical protein [Acidobacteriota bacterium]
MEEVQWDRQSFAQKAPPPKGGGSSILGPILFVLVVSIAGGAAYLYIQNNGIPEMGIQPSPQVQSNELLARLDEMNERLEQLEKRLHVSPPPSKSSASSQPSSTGAASSGSPARPAPGGNRAATSAYAPTPSSAPPPPRNSTPSPVATPVPSNLPSRDSTLQGELTSNREAWEATANRLGDAVGELGDQRRELADTQETIGEIQRNLERTYLPFDIRKSAGRQRIGPIWMDLRSVDRRAQRYTMRLFFDDRWVEMKDRVLGERLEFYVRGTSTPLELVISEIGQDQVMGQLGLPKEGTAR